MFRQVGSGAVGNPREAVRQLLGVGRTCRHRRRAGRRPRSRRTGNESLGGTIGRKPVDHSASRGVLQWNAGRRRIRVRCRRDGRGWHSRQSGVQGRGRRERRLWRSRARRWSCRRRRRFGRSRLIASGPGTRPGSGRIVDERDHPIGRVNIWIDGAASQASQVRPSGRGNDARHFDNPRGPGRARDAQTDLFSLGTANHGEVGAECSGIVTDIDAGLVDRSLLRHDRHDAQRRSGDPIPSAGQLRLAETVAGAGGPRGHRDRCRSVGVARGTHGPLAVTAQAGQKEPGGSDGHEAAQNPDRRPATAVASAQLLLQLRHRRIPGRGSRGTAESFGQVVHRSSPSTPSPSSRSLASEVRRCTFTVAVLQCIATAISVAGMPR